MLQGNQFEVVRTMFEILMNGPKWKCRHPRSETAILVLPGIHQEYRITGGLDLWKQGAGFHVWFAGTRGDPAYTREDIVKVSEIDSPNIVAGPFCRHTPDQMTWCLGMLRDNPSIRHLIVATAAYHLPRCVLTLLATLEKAGVVWIPITPIPLTNPSGDSFSPAGSEDLASEMGKILEFQASGDVASFDLWRQYLAWRLTQ